MIKMRKKISMITVRLLLAALSGTFVFMCFAQPTAPDVSIEIVSVDGVDYARLSWENVEGAESYNIYISNNPYPEYWGEPVETVGVTEYITEEPLDTLGNHCYFLVTAYQFPDWLILVDGDLFNGDVTIDPFYISKYPVTQSDFVDIMGEWDFHFGGNPTHPAESVSWFNAIEYCNRLSIRDELEPVYSYNDRSDPDDWYEQWPGWNEDYDNHTNVACNWEADGYRLPTEAEWQHAANGARYIPDSEWPFGSPYQYAGSNDVDEVAWYADNAGETTHPVGELSPNGLGIYDMSGNVFEWCWDIYDRTVFPSGGDNPRGPDAGTGRVVRGGNWSYNATYCAVSFRHLDLATNHPDFIGFRICRGLGN